MTLTVVCDELSVTSLELTNKQAVAISSDNPGYKLREFIVNVPQCYSLAYKIVSSKNDESLPEGFSETYLSPENGILTVRPTKTNQPAEYKFFVAVESD